MPSGWRIHPCGIADVSFLPQAVGREASSIKLKGWKLLPSAVREGILLGALLRDASSLRFEGLVRAP